MWTDTERDSDHFATNRCHRQFITDKCRITMSLMSLFMRKFIIKQEDEVKQKKSLKSIHAAWKARIISCPKKSNRFNTAFWDCLRCVHRQLPNLIAFLFISRRWISPGHAVWGLPKEPQRGRSAALCLNALVAPYHSLGLEPVPPVP